jgi:hypothetical protein
MAIYRYCDTNKEPLLGSDSLVYIDDRLTTYNKILAANKNIKTLQGIKPSFKPAYIAKFNHRLDPINFIKL